MRWYERESTGLGGRLLEAFEHAVSLLREQSPPVLPMDGVAGRKGAKRIILRRFPFSLIVVHRNDEYVVVALAHHSRTPGYWQRRMRT